MGASKNQLQLSKTIFRAIHQKTLSIISSGTVSRGSTRPASHLISRRNFHRPSDRINVARLSGRNVYPDETPGMFPPRFAPGGINETTVMETVSIRWAFVVELQLPN